MDQIEIIKLYQMLIHNINGLKELESPSFTVLLLLQKAINLLDKYKATNVIYNLNKGRELVDNYNHFIKQRDAATAIKREQEITLVSVSL